MAVVQVNLEDTFNEWRGKTNQISQSVGDTSQLETQSTDLVGAVNEVNENLTGFSIAMSIALG